MKLSFSTLGCPGWSFGEIVLRASQYGYEGVAFRGLGGQLDLTKVPEFFPCGASKHAPPTEGGWARNEHGSDVRYDDDRGRREA